MRRGGTPKLGAMARASTEGIVRGEVGAVAPPDTTMRRPGGVQDGGGGANAKRSERSLATSEMSELSLASGVVAPPDTTRPQPEVKCR